MKPVILLFLVAALTTGLFGQGTQVRPITQAEYVRYLYDLQKNPKKKSELIDAIRSRGIAFELTDGLRGLTSSKSGADAELRRTIEEAARRKGAPVAATLPPKGETDALIEKSRTATLAAVEAMPDFVVKQMIQRSYAFAGTNNFKNLDRLIVAVSYRTPDISGAKGAEEYKVLSINGVIQDNPSAKGSYQEVGGTSSTGEFVTMLATIFKGENLTEFNAIDTDLIRGQKAIVYEFETTVDKAQQVVSSVSHSVVDSTVTGIKGKVWIARDTARVLRVESQATEIPSDFRIRAANRTVDYDWVTIAEERYLLPISSDVRLTSREGRELFETRNQIRFKEYQKFGAEIRILDDDVIIDEPAETKKP
jgi:hypothetical protein